MLMNLVISKCKQDDFEKVSNLAKKKACLSQVQITVFGKKWMENALD